MFVNLTLTEAISIQNLGFKVLSSLTTMASVNLKNETSNPLKYILHIFLKL